MERGIRVLAATIFLLCAAGAALGTMTAVEIPRTEVGFRLPGTAPSVDSWVETHRVTGALGLAGLVLSGLLALHVTFRPRPEVALVWTMATLGIGGILALVAWHLHVVALPLNAVVLWPAHVFPWVVRAIGVTFVIQLVVIIAGTVREPALRAAVPPARVVRR